MSSGGCGRRPHPPLRINDRKPKLVLFVSAAIAYDRVLGGVWFLILILENRSFI